jgi:hypothetical protein
MWEMYTMFYSKYIIRKNRLENLDTQEDIIKTDLKDTECGNVDWI